MIFFGILPSKSHKNIFYLTNCPFIHACQTHKGKMRLKKNSTHYQLLHLFYLKLVDVVKKSRRCLKNMDDGTHPHHFFKKHSNKWQCNLLPVQQGIDFWQDAPTCLHLACYPKTLNIYKMKNLVITKKSLRTFRNISIAIWNFHYSSSWPER